MKKETVVSCALKERQTLSPEAFIVDSSEAKNDFLRFKQLAPVAWYREPLTGPNTANAAKAVKPLLGVLVQCDVAYEESSRVFVLRQGGVLLLGRGKSIRAIQPEFFRTRFLRCFEDGTEICRMSDTLMNQAVALSKANAQMRSKIQHISAAGVWMGLLRFWPISQKAKKMKQWNEQIQAHVNDLSLRRKIGFA